VGQVNIADSTSNDWLVTGIQLEAGTSATDFEFLPIDVSLGRCYRYFQKSFSYPDAPAQNVSSNNIIFVCAAGSGSAAFGTYGFPVQMRTSPTMVSFNPFASNSSFRQPSGSTDIAVTLTPKAKNFDVQTDSSGTTSLHGQFTADAEL
jgi:hypothetical protein